jgi:hypothetical protein
LLADPIRYRKIAAGLRYHCATVCNFKPFLLVLTLWPVSVFAQAPTGAPSLNAPPQDRFQDFLNAALLTPSPYVLALGGGVLDQFGNFPEEWSGNSSFTKRWLARQGMGFASDAIGHGVAAVIHHHVVYDACTCKGFARVKHAMGRAFVSIKDDGGSAPNYSLWVAKFSAAGVANAWYPESYQRSDIIREGAVGIVVAGGLNILKEFSPELLRIVPFK